MAAVGTIALLLAIFVVSQNDLVQADLRPVHEWKQMEYGFPTELDKQTAEANGQYVEGSGVPLDMDVHYKGSGRSRVFVTVPRFGPGVPITLGIVTDRLGPGGPLIQPYPDYSWHINQGRNCDGMTSVFRVKIDECNRLWVLDTGKIGDQVACQPQLLVFNLATDKMIHRYRIPATDVKGTTLLITPVVDVRDPAGKCRNSFVYMADVTGFGLVVYDFFNDRSWRVQNKLFYPVPEYGTHTIAGDTFDLMDGVFGLALSARGHRSGHNFNTINPASNGDEQVQNTSPRTLFFHALASRTENAVSTAVLDNSEEWLSNVESTPREFTVIGTRPYQSSAQDMDRNGNLFFSQLEPMSMTCWDSKTPYDHQNIFTVAQNDLTLQFPSGVKIINNLNGGQELWVSSCSYQRLAAGTLTNQTVNFRIQAADLSTLLRNGKCDRTVKYRGKIPGQRPGPPGGQIPNRYGSLVFPTK